VPISEIKSNYNGMLNPANPEVQEYELAILREFAEKYPDVDGIVFDRVRFDNITSDFSPLSKELFEAYCENANAGHALMGEAYFAQGFSLGVRLLLEALHAPRPG
jgi:uncharacterized lipoprotein YddW (UPF0748 family)